MHKIRSLLVIFGIGTLLVGASATTAGAVSVFPSCPSGSTGVLCSSNQDNAKDFARRIVNLLMFLIGIVAVIVIVIGGFQYVTSNGDSNKVIAAKSTILYSIIGLVVAILATLIVNTVITYLI